MLAGPSKAEEKGREPWASRGRALAEKTVDCVSQEAVWWVSKVKLSLSCFDLRDRE